MIGLLHDLADWVVRFATSDWAIIVLGVTSFFESIFFPIPPDPLLVGIAILQPHLAVWLGVLVTVTSVAGAVVGHWLGQRLGRPLLYRLFAEKKVQLVEDTFKRYGMLAIVVAAFTPLPYKLFAISAGALDLDRRTFVIASLVGRGTRFITLGALVYFYGESIEKFIAENFEAITVGVSLALIVGVVAWAIVRRRRPERADV